MNFAFVNSTRKWGGVKTWCLDMGVALKAQGHGVFLFGRKGPFVDKALALGLSARAVCFGSDINPGVILFFLRFFQRERIDTVVVNVSKDLRSAGIAARLAGVQVIQHVGSPGDLPDTLHIRLAQRLVRSRVVCCSEFVRRRFLDNVPLFRNYDVTTLHPGTVVPESQALDSHEPPVIVATSQLNPDKGHQDLLLALARLRDEKTAFRAVIAGTGTLEAELRTRCTGLGLDPLVEWTGFTTDVPGLLRRADIFVLPTPEEPLGIALEEGLAQGLAPVARNNGGVPEIWPLACREYLVEGEEGPEAIYRALKNLLGLPREDLLALRRAAWEHARTAFPIETQARKFAQWAAQRPASR